MAVSTAADGGLLLASLVVLGRWLGPTEYGRFWIAYAFATLGFLLLEMGLTAGVTRALARESSGHTRWLAAAVGVRTASGVPTLLVLVLLGLVLYGPALWPSILALGIAAWCFHLSQLFVAAFRAYGEMVAGLLVVLADRVVLLAGVMLTANGVFLGLPVETLFVGCGLLRLAIAVLMGRGHGLAAVRPSFNLVDWKMVLRDAVPLAVASAFGALAWRVDAVMLSALLPSPERVVGVYNAAFTVFSGATVMAAATNIVLMPHLAAAGPNGMSARSARAARRTLALGALLGFVVGTFVFLFAGPLVELLFGARFSDSANLLKFLAPALVAVHLSFVGYAMLVAAGQAGKLAATLALAAIANVTLNFVLIPAHGAAGAAVATSVSESGAALGSLWLLNRSGRWGAA